MNMNSVIEMHPITKMEYMRARKTADPRWTSKSFFFEPSALAGKDEYVEIIILYMEVKGEYYSGWRFGSVTNLTDKIKTLKVSETRKHVSVTFSKPFMVAA